MAMNVDNVVRKQDNKGVALISAAQDLTASWVDLGNEIDVRDSESIGVWVDLDINSSQNARIRALAKQSIGAAKEFVLPIRTISASDVKLEDEYFEFNVDADQQMILAIDTDELIPFIQMQVMVGTVGGTAGQIDSAEVTWKSPRAR